MSAADGGDPQSVVTAVLRHRGEILLLRRSDAVNEFPGRWGAVSGTIETADPVRDARREIAEETGLADACRLVRRGNPVAVSDDDRQWTVHPFLFDCDSRDVRLNVESTAADWVPATRILRRETVPALWAVYTEVAPTTETIAADRTHGAATISIHALEHLRDRAGAIATGATTPEADGWADCAAVARALCEARPAMAVVRNRIDRAMHTAAGLSDGDGRGDRPPSETAAAVEAAAIAGIDAAIAADGAAARELADRIAGKRVLTLSRSGTVREAIRAAPPDRLFVAESRPGREGVALATAVADACPVTVHTDAAIGTVLAERDVDCVAVGADAILPSGGVVNKTGTRPAAIAAAREGVPTYAAAAADKVRRDDDWPGECGPGTAIYDGDDPIETFDPRFDRTPADAVRVLTDRGPVDRDGIAAIAAAHRDRADWA